MGSVNGTNTETEGGNSARGSKHSDQPVGYAEMLAELKRYHERFGDQMREEPTDEAPNQADAHGMYCTWECRTVNHFPFLCLFMFKDPHTGK